MRIAVLGPLEVFTEDGASLTVAGAKERLLLAILTAGSPGVVSFDALADALWDGELPTSARKSLQVHVTRLRSSLEPHRPRGSTGRFVVRRGPGYALCLPRDAVDALRIGDLAARGRALLISGQPEDAARELAVAVGLWRGEPYADWPDAPFAEAERRRLAEVRAGAEAGLLEARLQLGRHADVLPDVERLVAVDPLREDWWRLLLLALYRAGRQADALAAGRRVRALLAEELGVSPGSALRELEAAILAQDPALDLPARRAPPAPVAGACPYKGLAAYQVTDAALFYGRHRLVQALVARLVDAQVLLVSGPSGAGKSSVVRAGLVPALAGGCLPGSRAWRPVIVTPGTAPVDVIAALTGDQPSEGSVILVCDQFEELWAPTVDAAERSAFLDAILALLDDGVVARCVVVVRGDGVGRLAEHPAFAERVGGSLVLVPGLTEAELREIVREPARAVGLRVEPELTDAVVADVLGQDGALPLLSTALVGTWERRRGDLLTLAGYLEAGGVKGALIRSAEAAYAALDDAGRALARRLFVRLADTDDGGALVRRPVPLSELDLTDDARRRVVDTFVDRRLLAVDSDRLEVAHEALLISWPRLVRWLEDDAAGRAVRRHLAPAARGWEAAGRPEEELYRGARLSAALDWADGSDADATPLEQQFLDASRTAADAELTAERDRADREAAARRRTRGLAAGLAAVLVLALVTAFLAVRAERAAQAASVVADANRLAALSTTAERLDLSLLLAAQAVRLADTPETQDGLLAALAEHGRVERAVGFDGFPFGMNLAGEGRVLFFLADAFMAWRVGVDTPPPAPVELPTDEESAKLLSGWRVSAPSPTDDALLAAGQTDDGEPWVGTVAIDGAFRVIAQGPVLGGLPVGGGFSPDGRLIQLLVGVPDGEQPETASRWRLTEITVADGSVRDTGLGGVVGAPVGDLSGGVEGNSAVLSDRTGAAAPVVIDVPGRRAAATAAVSRPAAALDIRPLPSGAAQMWDDGAMTLFDRGGAVVQQLDVHSEPVRDIVVAPDGTWAVTAGDGPLVVRWDVDAETGRWSRRDVLEGHGADVRELALDPAGERLFTMSQDDTIITWDMRPDGGFGESYPALDGRWISNRPQFIDGGGLLVAPTRPGSSAGEAGEGPGPGTESVAATVLDPATGEVVDQRVVGDTLARAYAGSSVAVSPDGSRVAVTWGLGTTVLDTRTLDVIGRVVLPPDGSVGPDGRPLPSTPVWGAGWTPDGRTLLLGASEGDVIQPSGGYVAAVDTASWEVEQKIPTGAVQSLETAPDERLIAVTSASAPETVLLDATTLEVVDRIPLAGGDLGTDLSFSPDGRMLAIGGQSGKLYVFDTGTWDLLAGPVVLHELALVQVEWLSDGRTVATSGQDGIVSLFDVERGLVRGRPLRPSGEATQGIAHLMPGPTDELVVLGGELLGRRYPLEPSAWLEEACAVVGRDLTQDEWERYLPDRPYEGSCG